MLLFAPGARCVTSFQAAQRAEDGARASVLPGRIDLQCPPGPGDPVHQLDPEPWIGRNRVGEVAAVVVDDLGEVRSINFEVGRHFNAGSVLRPGLGEAGHEVFARVYVDDMVATRRYVDLVRIVTRSVGGGDDRNESY